jgi:hypothetical protein
MTSQRAVSKRRYESIMCLILWSALHVGGLLYSVARNGADMCQHGQQATATSRGGALWANEKERNNSVANTPEDTASGVQCRWSNDWFVLKVMRHFLYTLGAHTREGGCRSAAPPNTPKPKFKKHSFCRYYDIKSFTWCLLQPKSAAD